VIQTKDLIGCASFFFFPQLLQCIQVMGPWPRQLQHERQGNPLGDTQARPRQLKLVTFKTQFLFTMAGRDLPKGHFNGSDPAPPFPTYSMAGESDDAVDKDKSQLTTSHKEMEAR